MSVSTCSIAFWTGSVVRSVVTDFRRGADVLNLGNLAKSGGALTLEDIQAAFGDDARAGTNMDLDGFAVEGGGTIVGDAHLNMVKENRLVGDDFSFVNDESAAGSWLQDLNAALPE